MSLRRPAVGRELTLLEGRFAISQLPPADPVPAWAAAGSWVSITRTRRELSIVSEESGVPDGVRSETGWRVFEVAGPVPFTETGVLEELLASLAAARISVFALSTFHTDYLLVRDSDLTARSRRSRKSAIRSRGKEGPLRRTTRLRRWP